MFFRTGAEMISRRIKPDVAIVTDVTHDTTTKGYNKLKQGDIKCGDGPSICIAPAIQKKLLKLIFETGTKNDIKFQRCVRNRGTGTDTDSFAYSGEGVASALISLPLKYMHTTNEIVNKSDVEQTIQLIYLSLVELSDRLKQHGAFKLDLFND
jgi:putative aminopeptidase FrvX